MGTSLTPGPSGSKLNPDRIFEFWNSGRGTGLMIAGAIVLVGGGYLALPFIVAGLHLLFTSLSFALASAVLAIAVGAVGTVLFNKKFWLALTVKADNISRRLLRAVIDEDPIGSGRQALSRMTKRLQEIKRQQVNVTTNCKRVEAQINENNDARQNELNLAKRALELKNERSQSQAEIHATNAQSYAESNAQLVPVAKQMRLVAQVLTKVADVSDGKIQVFSRKLDIKEKELAAKQAGQKAVAEARGLWKGSDQDLLSESLDSITTQIANAEADMEQFMNEVAPTLEADELQRGAAAEKGMVALNDWLNQQNKKPDAHSLLESGDARTLLLEAGSPTSAIPAAPAKAADAVPSSFDSLFK